RDRRRLPGSAPFFLRRHTKTLAFFRSSARFRADSFRKRWHRDPRGDPRLPLRPAPPREADRLLGDLFPRAPAPEGSRPGPRDRASPGQALPSRPTARSMPRLRLSVICCWMWRRRTEWKDG
ncbi:unnamed protein product, partial [Musa acuminata subsp. burmannicoides]